MFGESAGAFAIGAHLSAENHVPRKLFRAAIMQSGATAGCVLSAGIISGCDLPVFPDCNISLVI